MNTSALKESVVHEIYRSGDSDYMVSLARGLHVIQVFCDDDRGQLTIADITRLSGLSRTVVSRCLYTLQELGFVGREGRNFFLLPKVLKLGYGYVSTASLPTLAQPILDTLTKATSAASAVVVLEGDDVLYIAKSRPQQGHSVVTLSVSIGHRRPAHITASGLVMLASLTAAEVDQYLENLESETPAAKEGIRAQIARTRQDEFAITGLVFATSLRALAVPVKNVVGEVVASMVIAIYDEINSDEALVQKYLPPLQKSAAQLNHELVD